jgi:CMP-N-acetylneuraminic acid synthetase
MWTLKLENETIAPFFSDGGFCVNSQSLPAAYVVNGGFYLIAPEDLRKYRSFFVPGAVPLLVQSPIESLDIDTEWDFQMAEMILEKGLYVA